MRLTSFFGTTETKTQFEDFKIMIQNAQSINNKIDLLESILSEDSYQAICLSETWITEARQPYVHIHGYEFAAAYCRREREGGGVAILLPNGTKYINRQDLTNLTKEFIIECCAIELKPNIILISIYRGDREIEMFFNWLELLLNALKTHHYKKHIIIAGDFNLDPRKRPSQYKKVVDLMIEYHLHQIVKTATRETSTTSTCIDQVFTNNKQFSLTVDDNGLSDHKCIVYSFETCARTETKPIYITTRQFSNTEKISIFKSKLGKVNWRTLIEPNNNINTNYKIFNDKIRALLGESYPPRKTRVFRKNNKHWLTKWLKVSCKHKRILKTLVNQSKCKILKQ